MSYLSSEELSKLPLSIGKNVKISHLAVFNNIHLDSYIADNVRIDDFVIMSGKLEIGKYVHLAPLALLDGGDKGIVVSDFSSISYKSSIITRSDDFTGLAMSNPTVPAQFTMVKNAKVFLGRHVKIGMHSVILPDSNLRDGSSLALQSVFQGESEEFTLYRGNPARPICKISKRVLKLEKELRKSENLS